MIAGSVGAHSFADGTRKIERGWTMRPYAFTEARGGHVIVTLAKVADFEQFLRTFSTKGAEKRRQHGCTGSYVLRDPDDADRVWCFFDWEMEGYEKFLSDPEIPAIARGLALREPPVKVDPVAQYDS